MTAPRHLPPNAYEQLFAAAPVGVALIDADLACLEANSALARLNGVRCEDLIGPLASTLLPGMDPDLSANVRTVIEDGKTVSVQLMGGATPAQPGVARAWDLTYLPVLDADGERVAAACVVLEISERELLAEQVRIQARRHRLLAEFFEAVADADDENEVFAVLADRATDAIGDLAVVWSASGDGERLEPAAIDARDPSHVRVARERFAARPRPRSDAVGKPSFPVAGFLEAPMRVRGELAGILQLMRLEAGSPRYGAEDKELADAIAARAAVALESARARRELAESVARLQTVLRESPIGTVIVNTRWEVEFLNGAATEIFGLRPDVLGNPFPWDSLTCADEAGRAERGGAALLKLRASMQAGEPVRGSALRLCHAEQVVDLVVYSAPFRDASGHIVGTVLRAVDMSEQVRLEEELRRASSTLQAVLDASPLPLVATDADLRITFWNDAAERLYGWTSDEVLGSPSPAVPSERQAELERTVAHVRSGAEIEAVETIRMTKTGEKVEVRLFIAPLRDSTGSGTGILAVHEEIGARKQLEAQLFEARKMETVGRLAGGVAHDFNNIMTAIIGFAALSEMDTTDPELRHNLEAIRSAAERAAGLTRQLLAFGRRQVLIPRVLRANDAVHEVEPLLRRLIGEQIELVLSIDPTAGSLHADPTQLEQVLLNLALNARDAMPDGGRLVIATGVVSIAARGVLPDPELSPGEYVTITVSDTGIGMDDITKAHLFEPFFTTKEVGKGTGLGLATTYGIVKQSGGTIEVESEPGRGSVFRLYFPRVSEAVTEIERPVRRDFHVGGRVLLVEDEPMLRELAKQILAHNGYEVVSAANAMDALVIAERDTTIDLLLSDVVMPGMSGGELATRLRARQPDLPVVLMSGYAEETARPSGLRGFSFVGKPFTPDSLLGAVSAALMRTKAASRVL